MPDLIALAQTCAPSVAVETMVRIVTHESARNPFAIGINGGARLSRQPVNLQEAVDTALQLLAMGLSIDLGLAQINSKNLPMLGLTVKEVFDPCTNLKASETILRDCYDRYSARNGGGQIALQASLSCYNTGTFTRGINNGYVQSIFSVNVNK